MSRPGETFADEVSVMKALFQDYSKRNDVDIVNSVEQDITDICDTCAAREDDVRIAIQELSRQVHELQASARYPNREDEHTERVTALQRQISVAKQLVEELDEESRSLEQQRARIDEELRAASSTNQEVSAAVASEESLLRHKMSLYAHITRVVWQADTQHLVAGTVSDSAKDAQEIRRFSFDAASMSKFNLVNALWDVL